MKNIIFILLITVCFSFGDFYEKLEVKVENYAHKIHATDLTELDNDYAEEIVNHLQQNRPNAWNLHPDELNNIRERMEPLREHALQLARSNDHGQRYDAEVFLRYLKPDKVIIDTLMTLAHDNNHSVQSNALNTLFGMGWDTPELREEILTDLRGIANGEKSKMLSGTHVGRWGIKDAVPIIMEILEKTYFEKSLNKMGVMRQLRYLGGDAKEALPLLYRIQQKRLTEGDASFRELEAISFTISAIENDTGYQERTWQDIEGDFENNQITKDTSKITTSPTTEARKASALKSLLAILCIVLLFALVIVITRHFITKARK